MKRALKRCLLAAIWPGFLTACCLEFLIFAFVDPEELHWAGHAFMGPRQSVYTVAFFAFWIITSAGCALAAMLVREGD